MNQDSQETAIETAAAAARVAAEAAATAANVARDVAMRAAETAASVALMSSKAAENVLILGNDITYIKGELSDIKKKLENIYVTQDQFQPVKLIVYGMVGVLLLSVLGAIVKLVFIK